MGIVREKSVGKLIQTINCKGGESKKVHDSQYQYGRATERVEERIGELRDRG